MNSTQIQKLYEFYSQYQAVYRQEAMWLPYLDRQQEPLYIQNEHHQDQLSEKICDHVEAVSYSPAAGPSPALTLASGESCNVQKE